MSEIGCRNRKWNSNGRFGDIAGANVGVSGTFVTSHQGALTQNNIINVHFRNKPFPFQQKKIQKRPLPRIQISDSISDITGLVSAIELDLLDHSKNIYREDPGYGQLFGEFENKILLQSNPKDLQPVLISSPR